MEDPKYIGDIYCHASSKDRNPNSYISTWHSSWKSKVAVKFQILHSKQKEEQEVSQFSRSVVSDSATPWTVAH